MTIVDNTPVTRRTLSVVIPTYRDWKRLSLCIAALQKQSFPAEDFEIIVVDNDDNPLPEQQRPPRVTYVHEPEGFSYAARNAGLKYAHGKIIAFTDADCIPDTHWLEKGYRKLQMSPTVDLIGGKIELFSEVDSLASRYDKVYGLNQQLYFQQWNAFATANLFIRREVADCLDGFNARLESFGDFDFCHRAIDAGFQLEYAPEVIIRHPTRSSVSDLLKVNSRITRGFSAYELLRRKVGWFHSLLAVFGHLKPRPIDWYHTLAGGRGSEAFPWHQRPALLALRMLMHYHFAWHLFGARLVDFGKTHDE